MKKNLVIGMLADVDAGKTTLSEAILHKRDVINKIGRVDHGNTFLDTYSIEKKRGITIFSKQAVFQTDHFNITLIDTPGHIDFSFEMERILDILDMAIIIVSVSDGITGQLKTIAKLLNYYGLPAIVFVNKMDQSGFSLTEITKELKTAFSREIIDFQSRSFSDKDFEEMAILDDGILENYLEGKNPSKTDIKNLIEKNRLIPLCYGSALKLEGIENLIEIIDEYSCQNSYGTSFSAKVFKISQDSGKRLCWLKITGGSLKVKDEVNTGKKIEKIDEIRIYSGAKYKNIPEITSGTICAVTGLSEAKEGLNLGSETARKIRLIEGVMRYKIIIPDDKDVASVYKDLLYLEDENPTLKTEIDRENNSISVELMGSVQAEIIKELVKERFFYDIDFSTPEIVYKETIASSVEGVGHFEPLRHYAEVHLILEPGEEGSGIQINSKCEENQIPVNYQKTIISALRNKKLKGVLTGSEITDIKITLVCGKDHEKHTDGGDFREAAYRAVRQGLMYAKNVLLEPYFKFEASLPEKNVGKFMHDISEMGGSFDLPENNGEFLLIKGEVPSSSYKDYSITFISYTGGKGRISVVFSGYKPCHNAEEIIKIKSYDPERDLENPSASVFCMHGVGTIIPWNKVKEYMHVDSYMDFGRRRDDLDEGKNGLYVNIGNEDNRSFKDKERKRLAEDEELKQIFERTYGPIKRKIYKNEERVFSYEEKKKPEVKIKRNAVKSEYLLVDGYNIIFAWDNLKRLAVDDIKSARDALLEKMSNYAGISGYKVIVVFDAYKVPGGERHIYRHINIDVVFTKEAETADLYIEQAAHRLGKDYSVTVATSDAIEQIIVFGAGAIRLSAMNFLERVKAAEAEIEEKISNNRKIRD